MKPSSSSSPVRRRLLFHFFLLIVAVLVQSSSTAAEQSQQQRPNPPILEDKARVKRHYHKSGELIQGEEDLLKFIVFWKPVPDAKLYELSFEFENHPEEQNPIRLETYDPSLKSSGMTRPRWIIENCPKGNVKVRIRVDTSSSSTTSLKNWSDWSEPAIYSVTESTIGMTSKIIDKGDDANDKDDEDDSTSKSEL